MMTDDITKLQKLSNEIPQEFPAIASHNVMT